MNFNTGKLFVMLTLLLLSLSLSISAASAQTVVIADGSAGSGATTTVTITGNDVVDLANFDITVTYDPAVVNVTSAVNDAAFGGNNNLAGASTGSVRLQSFNSGAGQTGDGVLLSTLTLEAIGTANQTSALTITINELIDSSEGTIAATPDNGVFTISGVVTGPVVTINDSSADSGATTTVTITANDVVDLANFDITVTYDPAVVNVTSAVNDAAFGGNNNLAGASSGSVRLQSFNSGAGQTGDGVLLSTLTLEAIGTANQTSALTITINELIDSSEGTIAATPDNGVFTISDVSTPPLPTSYWGELTENGVLMVNTTITVYDASGTEIATTTSTSSGLYQINVSWDDPATTSVDEGVVEGEVINFTVSGEIVESRTIDAQGTNTKLNLNLIVPDTTAPVVTITTPVNDSTVNTSPVIVNGTATDNVGVTSLTVNANAVTLETDGSYSTTVTLASGANNITVVATDAAGNTMTETVTVTYIEIPGTLDSIAVTGDASVVNGSTGNYYIATATYSNATSAEITAAWTSSNETVATIDSATGELTALTEGITTVTATSGSVNGTLDVTVTATPVLTTITVTPETISVGVDLTETFTESSKDQFGNAITATVTWSSSNTSVGTITSTGVFTAIAEGTTTITATSGSVVSNGATVIVMIIAKPSYPTSYWGVITDNGTVMPDTEITVRDASGTVIATNTSTSGGLYKVNVPWDDPATTSVDEGVVEGETITFEVLGKTVATRVIDAQGTNTELNLTVTVGAGIAGDINGDGSVTSVDALMVLQMTVGNLTETASADINGDGSVTSVDALMILQAVVGNITL